MPNHWLEQATISFAVMVDDLEVFRKWITEPLTAANIESIAYQVLEPYVIFYVKAPREKRTTFIKCLRDAIDLHHWHKTGITSEGTTVIGPNAQTT